MINRIQPVGPVNAYKTFQIVSPLSTHFRDGTCEDAGCLAQRNGWQTTVDETTDLGMRQAHYIRKAAGRRYVETRTETGLTCFTFEAGQKCFATHKVPLERPEFYLVRDGDWRDLGPAQHRSVDGWLNDFAENQDRIARELYG